MIGFVQNVLQWKKIFTLDEIEPLIPLHPQCRCVALPYIEDLENITQIKTKVMVRD